MLPKMKECPVCKETIILATEPMCIECKERSVNNKKPVGMSSIIPIERLNHFQYYGTNAKEIYLQCCVGMGWNSKNVGRFLRQKPLYADNSDATRTMAVWFVCHSNLCDNIEIVAEIDGQKVKKNRNFVYAKNDGDQIDEYYPHEQFDGNVNKFQKRITFVKDQTGQYRFYGVYQIEKVSQDNRDRVFKRVTEEFRR